MVSWGETPSIGIIHATFKASFDGVESTADKIVIICPLWLLLVFLAIFLIIFKILWGRKKEKK